MSTVRQRIDRYQMPNGEEKILPCVCEDYKLCLWHYAEQVRRDQARSQEAYVFLKKKLEDKDAQPDQRPSATDFHRGGGRSDTAVRGDHRGKGARSEKAFRKPAQER